MDSDKHVTVEFELIPVHWLTTYVVGGHGDIEPNLPGSGSQFLEGTEVLLTAKPDPNYRVKA